MGGHPFPEIPCTICNKAVNLSADLATDENGKAVHEECYVTHITGSRSNIRTMATINTSAATSSNSHNYG